MPSLDTELRNELTDRANEQAIKMFKVNLKPLLMQPPLKHKRILGFDPGYRTGCKLAVIDENGKVLDKGVVFATPPQNKIAESEKLPSAKRKDSQGICFLGKINYNDFIRSYLGEKEGDIIELETGKKLGKHKGFWFHTIGQRKGLGLGGGPWFVVKKDIPNNILYVSQGYDPITQYGMDMTLGNMHFITEDVFGDFEGEKEIRFKIRHTPDFTKGWIKKEKDKYHVRFAEKLQGVAEGQYGVIYDTDCKLCYGSGVIM